MVGLPKLPAHAWSLLLRLAIRAFDADGHKIRLRRAETLAILEFTHAMADIRLMEESGLLTAKDAEAARHRLRQSHGLLAPSQIPNELVEEPEPVAVPRSIASRRQPHRHLLHRRIRQSGNV